MQSVAPFEKYGEQLPESYKDARYVKDRICRVKIIGSCLRRYPPFNKLPRATQEAYIRRAERSCYNYTCNKAMEMGVPRNWKTTAQKDISMFRRIYSTTCYRVQSNLDFDPEDPSSTYLLKKIVDGTFDITTIGESKSRTLNPNISAKIYDEISIREKQVLTKKTSTQHRCSKCGNRKTTETETQTRSLDEGSTIQVTCEHEGCGHKWFSGGS